MSPLILLFTVVAQTPTPPPADAAEDAPPPARVETEAKQEDEEDDEDEEDEEDEGPWTGSAGLGLAFFSGNTRSFTVTAAALAELDTPKWAATLEADGAYGEAAEGDDAERELTAKTLGGWARGEYRVNPLLSAYSFVGAETDHPASLELRTEVELGIGVTFLESEEEDDNEMFLRGYLGGSYARDRRFQYIPTRENLPDVTLWSPALGLAFRYDVNEHVEFREDAVLLPDVFGDTRVLFDSTTKLAVHLTKRFSLTTFFELQHDSSPAEGKVRTDTSLSLGGEVSL
jgi:putative salt-induced outer membrane protein YdiY